MRVRYPAETAGHYNFIYYLFIYLSFSARSGSMREVSCGSTMPAIIISLSLFLYYYFFIKMYFFIYSILVLFSACSGRMPSGSMREASCSSMIPAIIIYLLSLFLYYFFIHSI
jgi:hypothetical protein